MPTEKKGKTIEDVVSWIELMGEKGYYPRGTVKNRIRAIKNVVTVLEEEEKKDIKVLLEHLDGIVDRWATRTNAAPKTIQPTKSHAKRILKDYLDYQTNPGGFKVGRRGGQTKETFERKPVVPRKPKEVPGDTARKGDRIIAKTPDFNINIQINIPSDAPDSKIDKIFESMAKHIFRKNGE